MMVVARGELERGDCPCVVFNKTRAPPIPAVLDQRSTQHGHFGFARGSSWM